jgi:hypothetical protein
MKSARQFDALDARQGYPLPLELNLDAAAQLSGDFILTSGGGPHLQSHRG